MDARDRISTLTRQYAALENQYEQKRDELSRHPMNVELASIKAKMKVCEGELLSIAPTVNNGDAIAITMPDCRYLIENKKVPSAITLAFLNEWLPSHWPPTGNAKDFVTSLWTSRPVKSAWSINATKKRKATD